MKDLFSARLKKSKKKILRRRTIQVTHKSTPIANMNPKKVDLPKDKANVSSEKQENSLRNISDSFISKTINHDRSM